eukprot:scaffold2353_cov167-Amphora_coffeaeformis.AAC.44
MKSAREGAPAIAGVEEGEFLEKRVRVIHEETRRRETNKDVTPTRNEETRHKLIHDDRLTRACSIPCCLRLIANGRPSHRWAEEEKDGPNVAKTIVTETRTSDMDDGVPPNSSRAARASLSTGPGVQENISLSRFEFEN